MFEINLNFLGLKFIIEISMFANFGTPKFYKYLRKTLCLYHIATLTLSIHVLRYNIAINVMGFFDATQFDDLKTPLNIFRTS